MLSRGVPMLLGGDECGRSQRGNNNAYCQDNEISWYDWRPLDRNRELLRFVRELIAFRKAHPVLSKERFYTPEKAAGSQIVLAPHSCAVLVRNGEMRRFQ